MSGLIRKATEAAVDGALGEVARQAGPSRMLAEARSAGLLAAEPFALALSAPPPDLAEIEQLVDAYGDARDHVGTIGDRWADGKASSPEMLAAHDAADRNRAALSAALRSYVPDDLAALLREQADAARDLAAAIMLSMLESRETKTARDRHAAACRGVDAWTRANLKETP